MDADSNLKPQALRPRVLRNRSQSAVTKTNTNDDSDASKHYLRHRHTHSHHHISIPHPSRRHAKDFLGLQNGNNSATSDLVKERNRVAEVAANGVPANESRRGSQAVAGLERGGHVLSSEEVDRIVIAEAGRNKSRQSEIQNALQSLSEQSMRFTRELDNGFYSLLEKLTGLKATLHNLEELSTMTAQLHDRIRSDTGELRQDVRHQLSSFGGFKAQKVKLEAMQSRVGDSKRKADGLSERLEAAKARVSVLEVREREWQDSLNWRLRWMWIGLGSIAGIILAVLLLQKFGPGMKADQHFNQSHEIELMKGKARNATEELGRIPKRIGIEQSSRSKSSPAMEVTGREDDAALQRIFEEL